MNQFSSNSHFFGLILILTLVLFVATYCVFTIVLGFGDPPLGREQYQNTGFGEKLSSSSRCYPNIGSPNQEETPKNIIYGGELLDMERDIHDNYAWFVDFPESPLVVPKLATELRFHIYTEDYVDAFDKVVVYVKGTQIQTNFITCKPINKPHPDPNTFVFTVPLKSYPSIYESEIAIIKAIAQTTVDNILEVVFTAPTYSIQSSVDTDINNNNTAVVYTRCDFKTQTINFGHPRRLYKIRMILDTNFDTFYENEYYKTLLTFNQGGRESTVEKQFKGNMLPAYPIIAFNGDPNDFLKSLTLSLEGKFRVVKPVIVQEEEKKTPGPIDPVPPPAPIIKPEDEVFNPFIWLRAADLPGTVENNIVNAWLSIGQEKKIMTGRGIGNSTPPVLNTDTADNTPFVRMGTGGKSKKNGNFFDMGTLKFNPSRGATFIVCIRFSAAVKPRYERIIQLGHDDGVHLAIGRYKNDDEFYFTGRVNVNGSLVRKQKRFNSITPGYWEVLAFRILEKNITLFKNNGVDYQDTDLPLGRLSDTLAPCLIGFSQAGNNDEYPSFDLREILIYDKGLTDTQLNTVRNMLNEKYKLQYM